MAFTPADPAKAEVRVTGTAPNQQLEFYIPAGPKGDPGSGDDAFIADKIRTAGSQTRSELNAAIAGVDKSTDALGRNFAMSLASTPQPLSRWRSKLSTDAANAKIVGMGDSTTDEIVEAKAIWDRLRNYHILAGNGLAGMNAANIVSFGHNGSKLADWWSNATWKAEITGSGAHLVVLSYGINDVRLGATTFSAFRSLLIQVVDYLRAQMPTTDIVLRIPNSFTSDNTQSWAAGWVSPLESAQAYSTLLRNVYFSLIGYWSDGVAVWDAQGRIFGPTAKPFAQTDGLMKDILHPSQAKGYPAIADALVDDLIGLYAVPARPAAAAAAASPLFDLIERADSTTTPGSATTGQVYTVTTGTAGVIAHTLYNPGAALARAVAKGVGPNGEHGVTFQTIDTSAAFLFRYTIGGGSWIYVTINAGNWEIFKIVSFTSTKLATLSAAANGDRVAVKASGSLVRLYINGAHVGAYDVPEVASGDYVGFQSNNSTARFRDLYSKALV